MLGLTAPLPRLVSAKQFAELVTLTQHTRSFGPSDTFSPGITVDRVADLDPHRFNAWLDDVVRDVARAIVRTAREAGAAPI